MSGKPEKTNAQNEARAELVCSEVRNEIVALQRDELSPLRAESVKLHLSSCPECREEALSLDLAVRDYGKLPAFVPPPDLVEATMRRVASAPAGAGLADHGGIERPRPVASKAHAGPSSAQAAPALAPDKRRPLVIGSGILRRHVNNPFVRVAVAAMLFVGVLLLRSDKVADAAGRAQRRLLGANASEAVDTARDAFLEKLRL